MNLLWNSIRFFAFGWVIAGLLFSFFRNFGTTTDGLVQLQGWDAIIFPLIFSSFAGIFFGFINFLFERFLIRRVPLWKLNLIAVATHLIGFALLITVVLTTFKTVGMLEEELDFPGFLARKDFIVAFVFISIMNVMLLVLRQINGMLGPGNLWKIIRGKFYTPRVEERIFMFLDLKSSTTIAEQLGHIRYSEFIQDCYIDLSVVQDHGAQVYQYVGDEVVLSWPMTHYNQLKNCLEAFWAYRNQLENRSDYYQEKYGLTPEFKAGINLGKVTAAEVGQIKREIAYHGDTLNTAARIQAKCNEFGKAILVSGNFYETIRSKENRYEFELVGKEQLRGKAKEVEIYTVEEPT